MTPKEYAEKRAAEGVGTTAAAEELARITGHTVRTVWRWLEGDQRPPAVCRLLEVYDAMLPYQRDALLSLCEFRAVRVTRGRA